MCGIVGGISFAGTFFPNQLELSEASAFLKYRGPDDQGELLLDLGSVKVSFAHRRLSIIDVSSTGHQPMTSASGKTTIVFNGEIYNYQDLKTELENKGFVFKTKSDTEVIINGFECWGIEETLKKLDGMFAFALFDKEQSIIHLARDRFGKKPLYYYTDHKRLAFSSDIRSFKSISGLNFTLDFHSLGYFFAELSTPHEQTIWKEVKKVLPGNYLSFTSNGIAKYKPYWNLQYTENCTLSWEEILEKTSLLLTKSVKKRLIADVKVSALLSGGIDSSLVVAKMAEASLGRVKTYSVGFKENRFNELPFAKQVAIKFNTDHTELIIGSHDLLNLNDLISEYGEPFSDPSMIPTYLISREISRDEKVVLGGDGGDEFFGGYDSYYFARKYDMVKAFGRLLPLAKILSSAYPSYRTNFLKNLLAQTKLQPHTLLNRNIGFNEGELKRLFNNEAFIKSLENEHQYIWNRYTPHSKSDLINVLSASIKTRLLNDYLVKLDRSSMYASLEVRSPFLDKDLAEFASTLKPSQLYRHKGTKSILKAIAEKYFAKDFVHRHKMGFGVPLGDWFKQELTTNLKEIILGGRQNLVDLNYELIETLIKEHIAGAADHTYKLWSLYVFHCWAKGNE